MRSVDEMAERTAEDCEPRAEELIAETYRQIRLIKETGEKPRRILMKKKLWETIDEYRRSMGTVEGPVPDYLSEDGLFGLEIWYGEDPDIRVE